MMIGLQCTWNLGSEGVRTILVLASLFFDLFSGHDSRGFGAYGLTVDLCDLVVGPVPKIKNIPKIATFVRVPKLVHCDAWYQL